MRPHADAPAAAPSPLAAPARAEACVVSRVGEMRDEAIRLAAVAGQPNIRRQDITDTIGRIAAWAEDVRALVLPPLAGARAAGATQDLVAAMDFEASWLRTAVVHALVQRDEIRRLATVIDTWADDLGGVIVHAPRTATILPMPARARHGAPAS